MKKYLIVILAVIFPVIVYAEGSVLNVTVKPSNEAPCINNAVNYECQFTVAYPHQDPQRIMVELRSGKFDTGESTKTFELTAPHKLVFKVTWTGYPAEMSIYANNRGAAVFPIAIKSLADKHFKNQPTISGTGVLSDYQLVRLGEPIGPGATYKGVGTINIPYGKEGKTTIKVHPIEYFPNTNKKDKTSKYRWKVNGQESTHTGDTYTLNHTKTNHSGTKIVVTAINDCGTGSDSNSIEFTVTRNGLEGKGTESITNQNINSERFIIATDAINVTNSNIVNNATVEMVAGKSIIINPKSVFTQGTKVRLHIKNATIPKSVVKSSPMETIPEVEEDLSLEFYYTTSIEQERLAIDKGICLSPNPTDGILNFRCSELGLECSVNIYSMAGTLIYSNDKLVDGNIIDLTNQTKGIYIAKILADGEVKTEKIVLK